VDGKAIRPPRPGGSARTPPSDPDFTQTTYTARGNPTRVRREVTAGSFVDEYFHCDVAGNRVKSLDPRNFATEYYYNDNFGAPNGEARTNSPPSELGGLQSFALLTRVKHPLNHWNNNQYDWVRTEYDGKSRPRRTSNPRGLANTTEGPPLPPPARHLICTTRART
jgi:hypothetical protein